MDVALRETYLERPEFTTQQVNVAGRPGILASGSIARDRARWADTVGAWLNDSEALAGLGNATAACVLLLPTSDAAAGTLWALCFGMGFQMLEQTRIVPGLGRRLAVRSADPARLRSLTYSRLDSRAFISRTSIPGGDDLLGFGAADLGNLVSRIVGPALLNDVLAGEAGRTVEIRGAESINLPLARDGSRLLSDLDSIERVLARQPQGELAIVEQLHELKSIDPRMPVLESRLDEALGTDDSMLGLAWPTELADEAVPLSHFEVTGLPRGFDYDSLPETATLESVLLPLAGLGDGDRVKRLDRMRVQALSDEGEPASNALPARRWLSYETNLDGRRYCLHDGRWFAVDEALAKRLETRLAAIFAAQSPIGALPDWRPAKTHEPEYNELLAEDLSGVCLDKRMVICESHPRRGFEAADVLTTDGVFLHVKAVDRSAPASHLFAQVGISVQALLQDGTAQARLRQLVGELGHDARMVPDRVYEVVVVMGNKRPPTAEQLPSFAQMRLVRLAEECAAMNVRLSVASVLRH